MAGLGPPAGYSPSAWRRPGHPPLIARIVKDVDARHKVYTRAGSLGRTRVPGMTNEFTSMSPRVPEKLLASIGLTPTLSFWNFSRYCGSLGAARNARPAPHRHIIICADPITPPNR